MRYLLLESLADGQTSALQSGGEQAVADAENLRVQVEVLHLRDKAEKQHQHAITPVVTNVSLVTAGQGCENNALIVSGLLLHTQTQVTPSPSSPAHCVPTSPDKPHTICVRPLLTSVHFLIWMKKYGS